ncbi:hypothetical protein BHAMNSH16_12245 [Brachyspira hampsonii]|uniref:Uncharacterized protein n=2 Tax=Brachyspira hampsonii TaxID=1287055 RepID=A0AAC9TW19_9SPIR|nr:DUF3226 domain-containing protein [Brachyspira hampsonii]ASJ22369.1 hypothetical protein BHAMNSH16_12245 [Brachyspira hampsonii]MBW5381017.1 hypothetical protein [Brachyspira hampsonii]MBW5410430.1 hypothetical protein [Brachyspira hampsonii]OEJ19226.1 hypothetical protein A9496_04940 [Brachyspira hampsonii]
MNNLIIVESKNDKFFIERLIEHSNINNVNVECICEFECLDGISNLNKKLKDIKFDKYDRVGIILDADKEGINKRIEFINNALKNVCDDVNLTVINKLEKSSKLDIDFVCYIMNVDGYGELETILKSIKKSDSVFADCLESWRECLKNNGKYISDKDFDKFYINNYIRFDTCSKSEQKQASKFCSFESAMKKDIWDLDNSILDDLKEFLKSLI